MVRAVSSLVLAVSLLTLSACGGADAKKDADKLDAKLLGKGKDADPALTAALEDQIMVDPSLSGQANTNAIRPADEPMQAPIPPEKGVAPPAPPREGATLGQIAANQAQVNKTSFEGCGLDVDYSMAWSTRLPADLPLYPEARVEEAAGSDTGNCRLRAVTFTSNASARSLVDFYLGAARRAGYSADHTVKDGEHYVGGTRKDGAAYYVILAGRDGGGTTADLVANHGS
jgi:hypothetical protein